MQSKKNTNILLYGIVGSEVILAQENGAYTEIDLKPLQVQQVSIVALRSYPLRILSREKIIVIIDDGKILSVVPEVSTSTLHGITNKQSSRFFHLLYNPLQNSEKVCSNVNSFVRCDTIPSSASASAQACFTSTPLYFRPLEYRSKHFVIPFASSELSIISDVETTCVVRQGYITHISFETEHINSTETNDHYTNSSLTINASSIRPLNETIIVNMSTRSTTTVAPLTTTVTLPSVNEVEIRVGMVSSNSSHRTFKHYFAAGSVVDCERSVHVIATNNKNDAKYNLQGDDKQEVNFRKYFPLSSKYTSCANIKSQNPNAPPGVYMLKNSILACCKDDTMGALNLELALNSNSVINQRDKILIKLSSPLADASSNIVCSQYLGSPAVVKENHFCSDFYDSKPKLCSNWTINLQLNTAVAFIYGKGSVFTLIEGTSFKAVRLKPILLQHNLYYERRRSSTH